MRKADILYKGAKAGELVQHDDGTFTFRYTDAWFQDQGRPPVSLTLPKNRQEYRADYLFPFFFNMLPEGHNRDAICRMERLDRDDHFGLLLTVAVNDAIGAVTVRKTAAHD